MAWAGCSIEESPELQTGSMEVRLFDSTGVEIFNALIYVDSAEKGQVTPAVLSGIAVGSRQLRVWKSGYYPTDTLVEVFQFDTTRISLSARVSPTGAIELSGAPEGVILLLNGEAIGQTPPAVFPSIGIGSYRISAYLPNSATDLPALWREQVLWADTASITVHFTEVTVGNQTGNLSIPFSLPSDWNRDYAVENWRGHVVLVNFWFVDCPNCIAEFPYLEQVFQESGGEGGFQILAVNPYDDMEAIRQFRIESQLTFPFVRDGDHVVSQIYGVGLYPTNLLVDKRGVIRYRVGRVTYDELRAWVDVLLAEQ
jgi:thiol-disulfide isomerase/thioredoxin